MPNFDHHFCKFLYNRVQDEIDEGCHALSEPGPKDITRADVMGHSAADYHSDLCNNFPTLMTCLTAAVCKGRSWEENIKVLSSYFETHSLISLDSATNNSGSSWPSRC